MVNVHPDTTVCIQPCHSHKPSGVMAGDVSSYCVVSLFSILFSPTPSFYQVLLRIQTENVIVRVYYQGILSSKLPAQEFGLPVSVVQTHEATKMDHLSENTLIAQSILFDVSCFIMSCNESRVSCPQLSLCFNNDLNLFCHILTYMHG